jgi:myosin-1
LQIAQGRAFATSMKEMIELLNSKVPSYVRCIKPNHRKQAMAVDQELVICPQATN